MMTERIINRLMSWIVIKKKRKTEEKKQENDNCILFWSGVMFFSHFYVVYIYLSKWHRKKKTLQPKIIKSKNMNIKKDCLSGIIIHYLKEKNESSLPLSYISLVCWMSNVLSHLLTHSSTARVKNKIFGCNTLTSFSRPLNNYIYILDRFLRTAEHTRELQGNLSLNLNNCVSKIFKHFFKVLIPLITKVNFYSCI